LSDQKTTLPVAEKRVDPDIARLEQEVSSALVPRSAFATVRVGRGVCRWSMPIWTTSNACLKNFKQNQANDFMLHCNGAGDVQFDANQALSL
jgi:hypothetical protein